MTYQRLKGGDPVRFADRNNKKRTGVFIEFGVDNYDVCKILADDTGKILISNRKTVKKVNN